MTDAPTDDGAEAGLFSLDRYDLGHVTEIERGAAVRIMTDPRQWSHAIEFRPLVSGDFVDGPLRVVVSLEVESGSIEVGALSTTGTTFLSAATVESGRHVVELRVPGLARCQSITIRNAAAGLSAVRVTNIAARPDREAEAADGPDLSAPYGTSRRGFWDKKARGPTTMLLHFLGHIGYRLYDLYDFRYAESGQLLWGDAIFLPDFSVPGPSHA